MVDVSYSPESNSDLIEDTSKFLMTNVLFEYFILLKFDSSKCTDNLNSMNLVNRDYHCVQDFSVYIYD